MSPKTIAFCAIVSASVESGQIVFPKHCWYTEQNRTEIHCTCVQEIVTRALDLVQVLAESEQMRKEADDTGPMAELEHWKMRMAKFNSLVEQIKSNECRTVIGMLQTAKSRVLKVSFKPLSLCH